MQRKITKCFPKYIYLAAHLIIFSTAFSFAIGLRQINYLVVGFAMFGSLIFVFTLSLSKKQEFLIYLFYLAIIASATYHAESLRISTILYLGIFIFSFVAYQRLLLAESLTLAQYAAILKIIILAYFGTLVSQQISILFDLPIFNLIVSNPEQFKLNSLAPEPSHSAVIVGFFMFSYLGTTDGFYKKDVNIGTAIIKEKLLWFAFIYTMITMQSGLAVVFLVIILSTYLSVRNIIFIAAITVFLAIAIFLTDFRTIAIERAIKFSSALFELDPDALLLADHSASMRILPIYYYIDTLSLFDLNFWIGHGTDYNITLFPNLIPGVEDDVSIGGVIPSLLLNYGIFSGLLLYYLIKKYCLNSLLSVEAFFLLLLLSTTAINTQLFWIGILLFSTNKYFSKNRGIRTSSLTDISVAWGGQ